MTRKILTIAAILLSLFLLVAGSVKSHKVYEPGEDEFGMQLFHKVGDRALVIDATFQGVDRIDGKLVTTYDRSTGGGKRACPT